MADTELKDFQPGEDVFSIGDDSDSVILAKKMEDALNEPNNTKPLAISDDEEEEEVTEIASNNDNNEIKDNIASETTPQAKEEQEQQTNTTPAKEITEHKEEEGEEEEEDKPEQTPSSPLDIALAHSKVNNHKEDEGIDSPPTLPKQPSVITINNFSTSPSLTQKSKALPPTPKSGSSSPTPAMAPSNPLGASTGEDSESRALTLNERYSSFFISLNIFS